MRQGTWMLLEDLSRSVWAFVRSPESFQDPNPTPLTYLPPPSNKALLNPPLLTIGFP